MAKIDEMPEYRAKLPRHSHDLSHDFHFTCTTAHLLPVFHDFLNAGETVQVGFNYFLRTQPLQSAAMCKLKTHIEYFFVPMQLLYQPFGSFFYEIADEFSSLFNGKADFVNLPVINFDAVIADCAISANGASRDVYKFNGKLVGESQNKLIYRLADHFGFDPFEMTNGAPAGEHLNPNTFPYQYLAYNCIYEYYYRLDSRETFNPKLFNFDSFYNSGVAIDPTVDIADYAYMFSVKYRPLASDYFTDVKVSPIVDVLNLANVNHLDVTNRWLSRGSNPSGDVLSSGSQGNSSGSILGSPLYNNDPSSSVVTNFGFNVAQQYNVSGFVLNGVDINTANIRALFANEKLWSITGRSKKHYDDQTLAHFGFKVPHDPKHQITCFGHDTGEINIGEVISTSNTYDSSTGSGSPLAEIAGKGYGSLKNKSHKFTAPCHGVVMVIFSVVADRNYFEGFPKYNVMTGRHDLYKPEFDHLGMQPVFWYETTDCVVSDWSKVFGWQYRYEQWKRRYNRMTGAFATRNAGVAVAPFASWVNASYSNLFDYEVTPNSDSFKVFLNYPSDINDLMLLPYQLTWDNAGSPYVSDPFIVDSRIECKKISTMSDYSLPRLDA